MTSQEEQMLNSLVERVNSTQLSERDPDAAALLTRGFSGNPNAIYILAQSVLVQNIALEQAKAQLVQAQEQSKAPAHASTFLGRLLGDKEPVPPPPPPAYRPQASPEYQTPYQGQGYQGQPYANAPYQGQPYAPPAYGAPGFGGGGFGGQGYGPPPGQPSFLRSAATTAAGVAAGALAFEGVESLLHGGFGHPGMGMGMGGWGMPGVGMGMGPGMGYERPVEENIVNNNYYDSPGGGMHEGNEHHYQDNAGDGSQLADSSWTEDSGQGFDNSGSGSDDFSSFSDTGDSGSSDTGGGGSNDDSGGF